MRRLHLYLGCFFAPLLLFFTISGVCQTFQLHVNRKDGYRAPSSIVKLSLPHMRQRLLESEEARPSAPFRWLVTAMCAGLVVSALLGIVMALRLERPLWVWASLVAGALAPLLILMG